MNELKKKKSRPPLIWHILNKYSVSEVWEDSFMLLEDRVAEWSFPVKDSTLASAEDHFSENHLRGDSALRSH